jgi:hypothetical protein
MIFQMNIGEMAVAFCHLQQTSRLDGRHEKLSFTVKLDGWQEWKRRR